MTNRSERVGFIGLGVMGSAMAKHLFAHVTFSKGAWSNLLIYQLQNLAAGI